MNIKKHNDEDLLLFLKQHEPIPPLTPANAEDELMALIAKEAPRVSRRKSKLIWLIPTAITAGVAVMWGQSRMGFSPQFTEQHNQEDAVTLVSQSQTNEELEAYLTETWLGTMEVTDYGTEDTYGYAELISDP